MENSTNPKERPILFSGEMVRAIREGRKTQTRRVVKLPHENSLGQWEPTTVGGQNGGRNKRGEAIPEQGSVWHTRTGDTLICPYGQPGDRLWVREKFQPLFADGVENHSQANWKTGKGYEISYPATDGIQEYFDQDDNLKSACKPSIHMPRWASRILLEITDVRVERLNEISEEDCIAEGCDLSKTEAAILAGWYENPIPAFRRRWEWIHGPGSWDKNPWVWVVWFKVLEGLAP